MLFYFFCAPGCLIPYQHRPPGPGGEKAFNRSCPLDLTGLCLLTEGTRDHLPATAHWVRGSGTVVGPLLDASSFPRELVQPSPVPAGSGPAAPGCLIPYQHRPPGPGGEKAFNRSCPLDLTGQCACLQRGPETTCRPQPTG